MKKVCLAIAYCYKYMLDSIKRRYGTENAKDDGAEKKEPLIKIGLEENMELPTTSKLKSH